MSELAVAAAQIECRPGDIDGNLALHLTVVAEARAQGIDLLVFPELSLTDYMSEPDVDALARTADAPELCRVAEAAGRTAVSMGFLERGEDGRIYNAQALLAGGRCLSVHRKLNLPSYGRLQETRHYCRGDTLTSAGWRDGWTVATLICADTWNPALPWLAALGGATLLATPVASSLDAVDEFDNPGGWHLNLRHTALTYGLPIVMANIVADAAGSRSGAARASSMPSGGISFGSMRRQGSAWRGSGRRMWSQRAPGFPQSATPIRSSFIPNSAVSSLQGNRRLRPMVARYVHVRTTRAYASAGPICHGSPEGPSRSAAIQSI